MLLDEIIDFAVDDTKPIAVMLRKCILLASHLKNGRLKTWANQELNGYEGANGVDLPEYRIVKAHAHGDFFAPTRFQAPLSNFPIASIALDERHRDFAGVVYLFEGVSAYQHVLQNRETSGRLIFEWPANLMAYYQHKPIVQGGFVLMKAWQEIPSNAVAHLLDTVRTRTLNMAVEIKEQLGEGRRGSA